MPTTKEMLAARIAAGKYLCIGLDPDLVKIPDCVPGKKVAERVFNFLIRIVDHTHHVALAYKPQIAFFEALGDDGHKILADLIDYIRGVDPTIPVILDFKRGDIGNTNAGYIDLAYEYFGADAVTLHPYLGLEAMKPFLAWPGKLSIILCRTSNPGAGEFQDVPVRPVRDTKTFRIYATAKEARRELGLGDDEGRFVHIETMPLYQFVAYRVRQSWNEVGDCAVVVGATWPDELYTVRDIVDRLFILVPGLGSQGGKVADVFPGALDGTRDGGVIANNASAINFAFDKLEKDGEKLFPPEQWAEAAGFAAEQMNTDIADRIASAN